MMKAVLTAAVVLTAIGISATARADTHTVTLGYAHADSDYLDKMTGVTGKYHYQDNNPLGIIGSFTYMWYDKTRYYRGGSVSQIKPKYYALLVGPSYQANHIISLYGMAGMARSQVDESYRLANGRYFSSSSHQNGLAYSIGVQLSLMANGVIDAGYEGARFRGMKAKGADRNIVMNSFNLGVGYRF